MNITSLLGIVAAPSLPMLPDHAIDWSTLRTYLRWIANQRPTAIAMNMDASEGPSIGTSSSKCCAQAAMRSRVRAR